MFRVGSSHGAQAPGKAADAQLPRTEPLCAIWNPSRPGLGLANIILECAGPYVHSPAGSQEPRTQKWSPSLSTYAPGAAVQAEGQERLKQAESAGQSCPESAGPSPAPPQTQRLPYSPQRAALYARNGLTPSEPHGLAAVINLVEKLRHREIHLPSLPVMCHGPGFKPRQAGGLDADFTVSGIFCEHDSQH